MAPVASRVMAADSAPPSMNVPPVCADHRPQCVYVPAATGFVTADPVMVPFDGDPHVVC